MGQLSIRWQRRVILEAKEFSDQYIPEDAAEKMVMIMLRHWLDEKSHALLDEICRKAATHKQSGLDFNWSWLYLLLAIELVMEFTRTVLPQRETSVGLITPTRGNLVGVFL